MTGIKVQWEVLPENQFRQKLTLELSANPESVDGFMSLSSWDGVAFYESKWYEPVEKYLKNPELTSPDFRFQRFLSQLRADCHDQGHSHRSAPYPKCR